MLLRSVRRCWVRWLQAITLAAGGCGVLVRPGAAIVADPQYVEFHAAKYRVYLQIYDDVERVKRLM
ncbi:MAG: hypothetical protein ACSLEN_02430 [Candidatus Malihini olakiniferum]